MPLDQSIGIPRPLVGLAGKIGAASQVVTVEQGSLVERGTNVQTVLESIQSGVNDLIAQSILTGRNFERVNTDLVIDNTNAALYDERIILYAAGIDKRVQWRLPTGAQLVTAGRTFPYVFETVHLGGTVRLPAVGQNRVDIDVQDGDTARVRTSGGLMNLLGTDMLRGDRIIWTKETESGDWFANTLRHDSSTFVLPEGVAELRPETIQDVTAIATELAGLSINRGDMFVVDDATGGTYFGRSIVKGDIIMAVVTNPSLVSSSEDFVVFDSSQTAVPNDLLLLLRNTLRTGTRFDFNRNVFVDEANVISFTSMATQIQTAFPYFTSGSGGPTGRTAVFANQNLQFSDLRGGTLSLSIQFAANSQSGFLPELNNLVLDYSGTQFTFPLNGVDPESGAVTVDTPSRNNIHANARRW